MEEKYNKGKLVIKVMDCAGAKAPVVRAKVFIHAAEPDSAEAERQTARKKDRKPDFDACLSEPIFETLTDHNGECIFECAAGTLNVSTRAFGQTVTKKVTIDDECHAEFVELCINIGFDIQTFIKGDDCEQVDCDVVVAGKIVMAEARHTVARDQLIGCPIRYSYSTHLPVIESNKENAILMETSGHTGLSPVTATITDPSGAHISAKSFFTIVPRPVQNIGGNVAVTLRRTATAPTTDLALWAVIRKSTESISFNNYNRFLEFVLCGIGSSPGGGQHAGDELINRLRHKRFLPYNDTDAYRLLKVATEAFLMVNCGVSLSGIKFTNDDLNDLLSHMSLDRSIDLGALNELWRCYLQNVNGTHDQTLPYLALIREKLRDQGRLKNTIFAAEDPGIALPEECFGLLRTKLTEPCLLELIWSYWHEEGMLVQTMNALSSRFQNIRNRGDYDPLAMLEIDPLRPLNNLLWGHIQDEQHRLSVVRRAYEYDHHYGLSLYGKAVPAIRGADSRSKFLEAFHNLLHLTSIFFKEDDDTTVIADGFPLLNALREVHFLLTEGAHNQFGDLPSTARQEMLIQQWILARPEFREFLPTRIMVAYPEPWMDRVDAMKKLQGWTDISVREFNSLGTFGEQILLSIRFGAWSTVHDPMQAANWARFWRPEIQGYVHAYRAVTGVDMTAELADTKQASERYLQPSFHLRNRLVAQRQTR